MLDVGVELVSVETMADILSVSQEVERVGTPDLMARRLKHPSGELILIEGMNGTGLLFRQKSA